MGWEDGATERRPHCESISALFPHSNQRERASGAQTPDALERKAVTTSQGGWGNLGPSLDREEGRRGQGMNKS